MNDTKLLLEVVEEYLTHFPEDRDQLGLLISQLVDGEHLNDRRNFRGHVAGDAIILSSDLKKVLLIHHIRYQRWNQPGGHWDPDEEGPWVTAEREAIEEAGVKFARRINLTEDVRVPLQITTGPVWPNAEREEPHHWHHDFRYGFIAASEELEKVTDKGVDGSKWEAIKDIDSSIIHSIAPAIERLKVRLKA